MVADDEVEQVYVSSATAARASPMRSSPRLSGRCARTATRSHGSRSSTATRRARSFYERMGWSDDGAFDYAGAVEDGARSRPLPPLREARLEAQLEQDDVAPDAVELPDPLADADLAEAERAVQREARAVVR